MSNASSIANSGLTYCSRMPPWRRTLARGSSHQAVSCCSTAMRGRLHANCCRCSCGAEYINSLGSKGSRLRLHAGQPPLLIRRGIASAYSCPRCGSETQTPLI